MELFLNHLFVHVSETVGNNHLYTGLLVLGQCLEQMFGGEGVNPGSFHLFTVRESLNSGGVQTSAMFHLAHALAVLIPFYLPQLVPVPYVSNNFIRIFFRSAGGVCLKLEV